MIPPDVLTSLLWFAFGLPIGAVTSVDGDSVRVQSFANWHSLEYVRVLDYVLSSALPSTHLADRAGPQR